MPSPHKNGGTPGKRSGGIRHRRTKKDRKDAFSDSGDNWSTEGSDRDEDQSERPRTKRRSSKGDSRTRDRDVVRPSKTSPKKSHRSNGRRKSTSFSRELEITDFFWTTGRFVGDILGQTATMLKTPIAFMCMVAFLLIALLMVFRWAAGAVCALPGSSYVLSGCAPVEQPTSIQDIQRLVWTHEELDRIQELAAGGASLPLFIKRGESAIREVSKRVELSELPSRHALVPLFGEFHQRARNAGTDIQRFYSHLGRTYDRAIGITMMTTRKLEEFQAVEAPENDEIGLGARALALFRTSSSDSSVSTAHHAQIRHEYLRHLDGLKGSIDQLIVANEVVVDNLVSLEDILYTIHDHAVEDEVQLTSAAREVKASLLQRFLPLLDAAGSQRLSGLQSSLETLDALRNARDVAARLFSGSLLQLRELSRELDDLRVRLVEHEVTVEQADVASLEYQIQAIRESLDAMQAGKAKASRARDDYRRDLQRQIDESFDQ